MMDKLPRREREIFEILCSLGEASAADVREKMSDRPSYSAVRTWLTRLEARGLLRHRAVNQAYIYSSVPQASKVRKNALHRLVDTFFEGSAANAATALLGMSDKLSDEEVERLQRAIDAATGRK